MTKHPIHMIGMPYVPGVATGALRKGRRGGVADSIVLITQHEINTFATLPAGFIAVEGAPFSHTMISLLGYGVPTVFISDQQAAELEAGSPLFVDGNTGRITNEWEAQDLQPGDLPHLKAGQAVLMADGEPIRLSASVRNSMAAKRAADLGAASIGLVRSEFLQTDDGSIPGAEFYHRAFRDVCEAAAPLAVTFRLLDLAADKTPNWLTGTQTVGGTLGLQGVRLYGNKSVQRVIEDQLDTIAMLTSRYEIGVLIPYLVRYEELNYWLERLRAKLPRTVPIGAMAETPASTLDIANWLERVDWVTIGCNDLMQCLYAADRDRPDLRDYFDPYAPFLFRFLRQVMDAAGEGRQRIQLCGVLSQLQGVLPVLLGLGYREFAVDVHFVPYLAKIVSSMTVAEAETLATQVCEARETREVLDILRLPTDRHRPFLTPE